jgi:hypothetical protein
MPGKPTRSPSEAEELSRAERHHAFGQVCEIIASLEAIRRTVDPEAPPADPRMIAAAILNAEPCAAGGVRLVGPTNDLPAVPAAVREEIAETRREFTEAGLQFPDDVLRILVDLRRAQLLTPSVGRELVAAYRARAMAELQAHFDQLVVRRAIDEMDAATGASPSPTPAS